MWSFLFSPRTLIEPALLSYYHEQIPPLFHYLPLLPITVVMGRISLDEESECVSMRICFPSSMKSILSS
jgi:hypothetical protein